MEGETNREREIREKREKREHREAEIRARLHEALSAWLDLTFASHPSRDEPLLRGFRIMMNEADNTWMCETEASQREEI